MYCCHLVVCFVLVLQTSSKSVFTIFLRKIWFFTFFRMLINFCPGVQLSINLGWIHTFKIMRLMCFDTICLFGASWIYLWNCWLDCIWLQSKYARLHWNNTDLASSDPISNIYEIVCHGLLSSKGMKNMHSWVKKYIYIYKFF